MTSKISKFPQIRQDVWSKAYEIYSHIPEDDLWDRMCYVASQMGFHLMYNEASKMAHDFDLPLDATEEQISELFLKFVSENGK